MMHRTHISTREMQNPQWRNPHHPALPDRQGHGSRHPHRPARQSARAHRALACLRAPPKNFSCSRKRCNALTTQGSHLRWSNMVSASPATWQTTYSPGEDTLSLDIDNFHHLAQSYNGRYPGLNLMHMDSPAALFHTLTDRSSDRAWRAVVRLAPGEQHHFVADVRTRAGEPPSVIVIEPANFYTFVTAYPNLRRQSLQWLGAEPKWAFIGVGAQKSAADCVMFGVNFALAAHHKSSTFDDWHENLHQHGTIADTDDESGRFIPSPDAMLEFAQISLFHGEHFLPALFFKHSHSRSVVDEVEEHQPGIKDKDMSSSRRDSKSESLRERLDAFSVLRTGKKPYSASIETSRATKVRSALDRMLEP